ncbi:D-lactate dehydrogenase (cytochrome) [Thiorhodococcus drewsii AZ1]|uniref:D-lactate dehydrogenase (Cytochrome) n=1 Tax=Thiorhodococcus drewsii AZ1 TaxID=765913 RepID=G2E037_9GAMM|nr:D-lactate dehydrogenase (cytochrome) [Thiorhodococcus drewsii AZ1]
MSQASSAWSSSLNTNNPIPPSIPELSNGFRRVLAHIAGDGRLLTDPADCWAYGYDNSRRHALPQAVVFASDEEQILQLVSLCRDAGVPLTARGRGTGTTGATVPDRGGVVLSLERMDRILQIIPEDRLAIVQPGVLNAQLQQAVGDLGFFWPPDPTSAATCTIGGNLAYNSAGPRAVKYGTARESTLGLRVVTGRGEALRTGVMTTKGVVGYDLTRLIIGSEGTLAIITEATLKLTPLPETKRTLRATYKDIHAAAAAVSAIMAQPIIPCALEFMDASAIATVRHYAEFDLPDGAGAALMIELDGSAACIEESVSAVCAAARNAGLLELRRAESKEEIAALWKTRKALSPTLRHIAPKKINEDVVVPVSRMGEFIEGLEQLSQSTGIRIVNFGHAGNGNIHVNLLIDPDDPDEVARAAECLDAVFALVLRLDGTLSGEHGVGIEKRDFVGQELGPTALALMADIKRCFDPAGILNAGKGFPSP